MNSESLEFLQELVETPSPAGYEERNLENWIRRIDEHADEVTTDSYGNTTATLNPGCNRSIVLTGHADEVGLMVRHISDDGYVYVKEIGTPHPGTARGQRVVLQGADGPITGVIGETPQFLQDEEEPERSPSIRDLYIDIGAPDRAQAEEAGIRVGTTITYDVGLERLLDETITGRGLDNRIGLWTAAEAFRELAQEELDVTVHAVATVQEEVGLQGAKMISYALNPDVALVVDVTFATDTPEVKFEDHGETKLGEGPTLYHGIFNHPRVLDRLRLVASDRDIPIQTDAVLGDGTDAGEFFTARSGIPTAWVGVPTRYLHTPVESVDLRDVANARELVVGFVASLTADFEFNKL